MYFEVIHKDFLNLLDYKELTVEKAVAHFAANGYDPLYITKDLKFFDVLTLKDFRRFGLKKTNKSYIRQIETFKNMLDIEKFFYFNTEAERLVILKGEEIFCEVNLMTEPPLINNIMKNLLALRFFKLYCKELKFEAFDNKKIFLFADSRIKEYFLTLFPYASVENTTDIGIIKLIDRNNYDFVFDFHFGRGLLKVLEVLEYVDDFYTIIESYALKILIKYVTEKRVLLMFYKIPRSQELLSLTDEEKNNFMSKISISQLAADEEFLKKFAPSKKDRIFIQKRKFTNSLRIDNGYFIFQSDCCDTDINIKNGIRKNIYFTGMEKFSAHIFGPCTVFGMLVTDKETIDSQISKMCILNDMKIAVHNHGGLHGDNFLNSIIYALNTYVSENDVIIFLDFLDDFDSKIFPNMIETYELFNKNKSYSEIMFFDSPEHCNAKGNKIFADKIFADLKDFYKDMSFDKAKRNLQINRGNQIDSNDLYCTHSAAIKFEKQLLKIQKNDLSVANIGCLLLRGRNFEQLKIDYLRKIFSFCDFLYIFVSCEIEENFFLENIFSNLEKILDNESICVVKADHFFCHMRFNTTDYSEEYVEDFVTVAEKIFCLGVKKFLNVNVRFFLEHEKDPILKLFDEYATFICKEYHINIEYI